MFRYLDVKGKGKVKKAEFVSAVEKTRISLSKADMTEVFKRIDTNNQGYITYQDICAAAARKSILDPRNTVATTERARDNLIK